MKTIFAICLMSLATIASATTVKIYEAPAQSYYARYSRFSFGVNTALGRAWVEMTETTSSDEPDSTNSVKVSGLTYNSETGAVEFKSGDEVVDCAYVIERGRGIFKSTRIKETGRCSFEIEIINVPVDDGFYVKNVKYSQVYFIAE